MKTLEAVMDTCDRIVRYFERNENSILLKSGIVCSIGAVITACIATHKSEKVIAETKKDIEEVRQFSDSDEKDIQKDIVNIGLKGAAKVVALYAFPAVLEGKAIHDFCKSNNNLKLEIASWQSIAGTALFELDTIRRRVFDNYGEDGENKIFYGMEKKSITVLEDGKPKKKKVYVAEGEPSNPNILCFSPWTSPLYCDEERYDCQGTNKKRIDGVFKMMNRYLETSTKKFINTNDIAYELGIRESKQWYNSGKIYGEGYLEHTVHEAYELWEGRYIPIYYIEVNTTPYLYERLSAALPDAPIYNV